MTKFYLIYETPELKELKERQHIIDKTHENSLDALTSGVTDMVLAEKIFAAHYFIGNLKKINRILNDDTVVSIAKEDYIRERNEMINDYNTLAAKEFLNKRDFYVVTD